MKRRLVAVLALVALAVALAACSIILGNVRPVARFTATTTSGTTPLNVSFDASTTYDPDGTIAIYFWSFGDGQTAAGIVTPVHQFTVQTDPVRFTVVLAVIDNQGGTDTAVGTIQVSP